MAIMTNRRRVLPHGMMRAFLLESRMLATALVIVAVLAAAAIRYAVTDRDMDGY